MKSSNTLRLISALLLLFPAVLLTGCAKQQEPQVEYRTIKQPRLKLPVSLTSPIDVPAVPDLMTFGDSVSLNADLYSIISQCNVDRAGIREIEAQQ